MSRRCGSWWPTRRDKLRLINVWATWCGPVRHRVPGAIAINRMYRGRPFELVTLSADQPARQDQVQAFLEKQQASCRNCLFSLEDKYRLIEAVDPSWPGALPYTLLVAPGGQVLYRSTGVFDPLELKTAIIGHLGRYYE